MKLGTVQRGVNITSMHWVDLSGESIVYRNDQVSKSFAWHNSLTCCDLVKLARYVYMYIHVCMVGSGAYLNGNGHLSWLHGHITDVPNNPQ